jgi:hypothetical protein
MDAGANTQAAITAMKKNIFLAMFMIFSPLLFFKKLMR